MRIVIDIPEEVYRAYKMDSSLSLLNADQKSIAESYLINELINGTLLNDVFDKIKAEIREFSVIDESGTYRISTYLVDQIIDKYREVTE